MGFSNTSKLSGRVLLLFTSRNQAVAGFFTFFTESLLDKTSIFVDILVRSTALFECSTSLNPAFSKY